MKVKEAVTTAKTYVQDLFASESISDLGLEEVFFEPQAEEWVVTVAFSRPWKKCRRVFFRISGGGRLAEVL